MNPGDTVIVEDGTYTRAGSNPCVVCLSRGGTATNWVVFKSRNKHGARIDGQSGLAAEGFRFSGSANYMRVEGFEVFGMAQVR